MTQQEIIEMAGHRQVPQWVMKLVCDAVAKEREACAKVCEDRQEAWRKAGFWKDVHEFREMAFYIRARGEA